MKFLLAFVGTVCLMGGIHAQIGVVATTLASAISASTANLASTIQSVNNSVNAADQIILNSWTSYVNGMIDLYSSYLTKYQDYTTVDLSQITNAISNMQGMMTNTPQLMQNDMYNVQEIFTDAQTSAQQIQDALNAAIVTMTCGSTCTSAKAVTCANKFGDQLTTAPITIDRITACVDAEATRFAEIAADVAEQYTNSLTMAVNFLQLDNMCDIPAAAVLNNPSSPMGPPFTQCFSTYLQRFSNTPSYYYTAELPRMTQTQLVGFRAKRCTKLVTLDIQERINVVLAKYARCL